MSELEKEALIPDTEQEEAEVRALTPKPHLGLTREEMTWAALAHASILVTFLLGVASGSLAAIVGVAIPAIIWYVYREKSEYVVEQARQATIFQLAGILVWWALILVGGLVLAVGAVVGAVLTVVIVGLIVLLAIAVLAVVWGAAILLLPIAQVVYGCYAAAETYNGRPFRYRWVADLTDRYLAQV